MKRRRDSRHGCRLRISVEHARGMRYGNDSLKAQALNSNDPYSWRCIQAHVVRAPAPQPVVRDHRIQPKVRAPEVSHGDDLSVTTERQKL